MAHSGRQWPAGKCKVKQRPHEFATGVATSNASPQVAQANVTSLIEVARSQWESLVKAPDGIVGTTFGLFGITATDLSFNTGSSEKNRDARGSEGGFNDQLFFPNANFLMALNSQEQQPVSNELGLNGNPPLATDRHAIDSQSDTGLIGKRTTLFGGIDNKDAASEANIIIDGSTIGDRPIGIADFDVGSDLSAPGSEGAIADFDVLNAESLSFISLQSLPGLVGQRNGVIGPPPFFNTAPDLAQSENQQNQNTLQLSLSLGSHTLPPDG
jgi:hypothetical protein